MISKTTTDQQTKSLEQLIKDVEGGKIVLPEFQRDFIWPEGKSLTLFDSLFRNLFIGSLIVSKPKFSLACKGFDFRPRRSTGRKPIVKEINENEFFEKDIFTLLDGQQRTTSICRALKGVDEVYVIFKKVEEFKNPNFIDQDNEAVGDELIDHIDGFSSKPPRDPNQFFMKISDFYHGGLHKSDSKIRREYVEPVLDGMTVTDEDKEIISNIALHIYGLFKNHILKREKLLSVQLIDMDLESFCLYFERSNSQGVNLSFTDIITAKVYINFKLKNAIDEVQKKYPYLSDKRWWVEQLLRYLNFKDYNEVTKGSILENLKADSFTNHWDNSTHLLNEVYSFLLSQNWAFNVNDLPYKAMMIPMVSFLENLPNQSFSKADSSQLDFLKLWFYLSILDLRYGGAHHGSTNVVLKQDCITLRELARGVYPNKDYWRAMNAKFEFDDLLNVDGNNAVFVGIMSFLNHQENFMNLQNDSKVDLTSLDKKNDIHHIFPKNLLKKRSIDENIDSLLNKMIICKKVNRGISDKEPSKYLSEFSSSNANLDKCMASQCIPVSVKDDSKLKYPQFLKDRFKLVSSRLGAIETARQSALKGNKSIW
jgi:hypothetical protein